MKPADIFGDDEQKPAKLAAIFGSKLYEELNQKLAECVSRTLKGKICSVFRNNLFYFFLQQTCLLNKK